MERFVIRGLGGKRALKGEITVKGAKNAALKAFAASLLFRGPVTLTNVPNIEDVKRMTDILSYIGATIEKRGPSGYRVTPPRAPAQKLPRTLAKRFRASIVLTGPLLARNGRVFFPHPGGCLIGPRPIDLFIEGFRKMGARAARRGEWYELKADGGRLRGAEIFFRNPSVTATETMLMAGVLARGTTTIKNAAMEPEISALAEFLNRSGARITGAGTPVISVLGGAPLKPPSRPFVTPPDRIEAGSFLILGALAARDLSVVGADSSHMEALIHTLRESGVSIEVEGKTIRVRGMRRPYRAINVRTKEYPGFPTDIHPLMTVYLTQSLGDSMVFETIFEGRLGYVDELLRMGASIEVCDLHRAIVRGPSRLSGKELASPDLRAGLALIIAAIVAKGESVIHNVYNIDRGYEDIEKRLQGVGVSIERVRH